MLWQQVSKEEAHQHPLYGGRGWMAFWSVAMVLSVPVIFAVLGSDLLADDASKYQELEPIVPWLADVSSALTIATAIAGISPVVMWFLRTRHFRAIWLGINFGVVPMANILLLLAIAYSFNEVRPGSFGPFLFATVPDMLANFSYLLVTIPFVVYMFRSRRFRVTFEHKIRVGNVTAASGNTPVLTYAK